MPDRPVRPVVPPLALPRRRSRSGRWLLAVAAFLVPLVVWAAPPPDILVLNSYAPGYEWSDDELAGLMTRLRGSNNEFEPVIQHLDYKRFPDPAREPALLADLVAKIRTRPPRLIVTLDDPAFTFALKYRADLGPEIPIVFGGVNRFAPEMIAGQSHITGVSEETDFSGTFRLIASLTPDARTILVIGNASASSVEKRRALEEVLPLYRDRYQFEFYENWTDAELIQRLATLPDGTVGLILDVTVDSDGHYNYRDGAFSQALATRSRVPVFITSRPPGRNDWTREPWDGLGGGLVVADVHGAAVGDLALRVLQGEPAGSIPVVRKTPERLEVDHRHLVRFRLPADRLPPGTAILNEPVTFYQVNRSRLVLAGAVFVVLCGIIVALIVTIIQRRRAELALRRTEHQLRSAQKMEAIGLLAGGVAHDFNNLLQVIRGHAGFLQQSTAGTPQDREDVEMILGATQRAAQLTRQLLVFSRKQALNPAPLDPNLLVRDLAKMLRRVLGEHIELVVTELPAPVTLIADKGQLEQVLLNLCLNARDAMPGGGRIQISLTRAELAAADGAKAPAGATRPYLQLKVADNGCGMPKEVQERLFEPFFTTKAPDKGTGLGLSVVYGIVHQHGGTISVYSEVGSGSVFRILLPLAAGPGAMLAPAAAEPFPPGEGTILLAEDDPQVRNLAVRVLEQNGFRVLTAGDGEQAEALLATNAADIRLAMLDVLMPKRTGQQVHETIKARYPAIRVLFCSGYSAEMLPPGTAPEASHALLHKPYTSGELLAAIHRLLRDAPS